MTWELVPIPMAVRADRVTGDAPVLRTLVEAAVERLVNDSKSTPPPLETSAKGLMTTFAAVDLTVTPTPPVTKASDKAVSVPPPMVTVPPP